MASAAGVSVAIALALRVKAPIYVAKTVLDRAPAIERHGDEPTAMTVLKRHGLTLQNLTASLATHFQLPVELRASDLRSTGKGERDWLWQGYLAPAMTTLLTSQWKSGKTTLVSVLLARLERGGQLLGERFVHQPLL